MTALAPAPARPVPAPLLEPQPPFRLRAAMNGIAEAPGKVWFFELAAAVIDADRCVQCGACIAACPTDSIGVSPANLPELVKMCTGCAQCWDFCPRGGLRYEATWLGGAGDEPAPASGNPAGAAGADLARRGLGAVLEAHAARVRPSSRYHAGRRQDGGLVTAILCAALESGAIDGAVVAAEDPAARWRGVPLVATTPEQLRQAAGSFYNQTMALGALDITRAGLPETARVALVGTPCEIEALAALQRHPWRRGASRTGAVVLTVALLCTKSFDYRKLMLEELAARRGLDLASVGKVDVVHGRFVVEDLAGGVVLDEPVGQLHAAALRGCDECADFLGRAADLAVGSVGSAAGWSSVLVRSLAGAEALGRLGDEVELAELERPEALEQLDRLDKRVAAAALARPLDPSAPYFIDFADHLAAYQGGERAPVWRGR